MVQYVYTPATNITGAMTPSSNPPGTIPERFYNRLQLEVTEPVGATGTGMVNVIMLSVKTVNTTDQNLLLSKPDINGNLYLDLANPFKPGSSIIVATGDLSFVNFTFPASSNSLPVYL